MKKHLTAAAWMLVGMFAMLALSQLGCSIGSFGWAKWIFWMSAAGLFMVDLAGVVRMPENDRREAPDVVAERNEALRRKQEIERDSRSEQECIMDLERNVWKNWAMLMALHCLFGLSAGMGWGMGNAAAGASVVGMILLGPLLSFALGSSEIRLPDPKTRLNEKDYPELFALVREVAAQSGHHRELRLFLGTSGIGVFRGQTFDGLLLPPVAVCFLTKAELRQVLRHEFAHLVSKELELEMRWTALMNRRNRSLEENILSQFAMLAMLPDLERFAARFERYRQLIESKLEAQANAVEMTPEEAKTAVQAIAKTGMYAIFNDEDRVSTYRCYASEETCKNQSTIRKQVFREMLEKRGRIWLEEMEHRQPAGFDTHPTFRQRREACGVTDYDAFTEETDAVWLGEMDRLCEQENRSLAGEIGYTQVRERMYISRKAAMESWEACADPLNELKSQQIIETAEAYFGLDTSKAIGILRAFLEKDPGNLTAMQLLGIMLLDERDDAGLELLYKVAENGNYAPTALTEAASYVYSHGSADEIAECDRRCGELYQQMAEFHYRMDEIRLQDLRPCTMSDELLDALVGEMVRLGEGRIAAIGCAAKDYSEREDGHVFVLKYVDDDDEARNEQIFSEVFELLDRREENYALCDDSELSISKLEKQVPGSIVYQKNKDR